MKVPKTGRKKALIVVDLQPAFIKEHNGYIINNVEALIKQVLYDAYIETVFAVEKGSLWDIQQDWICPEDESTHTVDSVARLLKKTNPLQIKKSTRSTFEGDQDVVKFLKDRGIEEVHIVGTETNDCVMATAFSAFDAGFLPYVLEECCESATPGRHQKGLDLLRIQGLTNNRCLANTFEIEIPK